MIRASWSHAGFLILVGFSAGMLLANLTEAQPNINTVSASGSANRYEEFCMVTGASYDQEIDILWLLDYRSGRLHCILMNRNGKLGGIGELDLLQMFEIEPGSRTKPHFMMVTGRYRTAQTDLCYLVETTSGQVLCLAPPGTPSPQRNMNVPATPRVVDRFQFRREGVVRPQ